ncbi:MAG: Transcriptional regulator, MerR family [Anaerolineae bacterium]|jgi:transcriptional regulator with XRE-family HTH domain|nr:MAG: Transcriptional regulator, MerR family [Anaerolineae bacterium]
MVTRQSRPSRRKSEVLKQPLPAVSTFASELTEVNVGANLRAIRTEQGLSIRVLAEMSGLNVNTLSMIENNKTSPSVSTLQRLASALRVPITAFFELGQETRSIVFQRVGQRRSVAFEHGTLEDLGGGLSLHGGVPLLVSLDPGSTSGGDPIVHTGLEFVYCLEGCVTYVIGEERYELQPGDSLIFEAHLPHRWGNFGSLSSRSLLILCPTDQRDRPHERHFSFSESLARGSSGIGGEK